MKALSLWQPWATLMALGLKKIETRSWGTKYRGPLAIHAARRIEFFVHLRIQAALEEAGLHSADLPRGGIIGTVDIVDCKEITIANRPDYPEWAFGDYTPGRFMWITENAKPFKKIIPIAGFQRIFNVNDELLRVCRVCGCSEFNACEGGCCWVEEDLCSACVGKD